MKWSQNTNFIKSLCKVLLFFRTQGLILNNILILKKSKQKHISKTSYLDTIQIKILNQGLWFEICKNMRWIFHLYSWDDVVGRFSNRCKLYWWLAPWEQQWFSHIWMINICTKTTGSITHSVNFVLHRILDLLYTIVSLIYFLLMAVCVIKFNKIVQLDRLLL